MVKTGENLLQTLMFKTHKHFYEQERKFNGGLHEQSFALLENSFRILPSEETNPLLMSLK